jgi:hypothetical protein
MKNTEKLQSHLFPSGGFRGGEMGRWHPLRENFFDFFPAKANEKQVRITSNASQNVFFCL